MATIKSFTSLEQSRKLAKILPLESADMSWTSIYDENHLMSDYRFDLIPYRFNSASSVPAWSLAALMNYLKEVDYFPKIQANEYEITMSIDYQDKDEDEIYTINIYAESFVDACYELILKLYELKML